MTTIISVNNNVQPSLFYAVYSGYMNDNPIFFITATLLPPGTSGTSGSDNQGFVNTIPNIVTGTNSFVRNSATKISVQWLGYFRSNFTGDWTFSTTSDDCSYVWLGDNAVTGYIIANAIVNNGGGHSSTKVTSSAQSLVIGKYYPIRIQFGQNTGGIAMIFTFSNTNGISNRTDGTGYFYNINNGVMRP
jgi:hypothetical protein